MIVFRYYWSVAVFRGEDTGLISCWTQEFFQDAGSVDGHLSSVQYQETSERMERCNSD
jgi:hypothetical protein